MLNAPKSLVKLSINKATKSKNLWLKINVSLLHEVIESSYTDNK